MAPPPLPLPLVFLLIVGASGAEWSVTYNQQKICALKGSTVSMTGSFEHPEGLKVTEKYWIIDPAIIKHWPDLQQNPDYSGRVEYSVNEQKRFSLKLSNVMKRDQHQYCFRIITDIESQKYLGRPGIMLNVTELHVESPGEVSEGESADLTCKSTCNLTDFIWNKDGHPLTTKIIQENQLHLQTVSSEDAGSYSCAVRGSEHLPSTAQPLRVRHPPKNVSVSISSSGGIVEGSIMNLTCSSDGYPPVEIYTWFKGSSSVGKGGTYSILNISSEDSGDYICQSRNKLGYKNSTAVSLDVQYPPKNVSVSISSSGEMVNLTCNSDGYPPVENYTWFEEGGSSPVGSGHSYVPLQNGSYYCQAQNQHGAQRSAAVPVVSNIQKHYYQSLILYAAAGVVGVCGLAVFLTVCFYRRRKRQGGIVDERVYANVIRKAPPPHNNDAADDDDSIPDYENVPDSNKH